VNRKTEMIVIVVDLIVWWKNSRRFWKSYQKRSMLL